MTVTYPFGTPAGSDTEPEGLRPGTTPSCWSAWAHRDTAGWAMLGVPDDNRAQLRAWADRLIAETAYTPPEIAEAIGQVDA